MVDVHRLAAKVAGATAAAAIAFMPHAAYAKSVTPAGSASPSAASAAARVTPVAVAPSTCTAATPGTFSCFAERRPSTGTHFAAMTGVPSGYGPSALRSAYSLPSATAGHGQRVYIVDAYNDPTAESDLAVYRARFGLRPCTTANGCFRKLNQNGAPSPLPAANAAWASEISLDLDMVSAVCPNCGITLVEANDNSANLFYAIATANRLGARFVSLSWGGRESAAAPVLDAAFFKPTGVVYTASSGDGAFAGGVSYPASSPRVVAVGGTSLSRVNGHWVEKAWRTASRDGAGSGCSAHEPKPTWQAHISSGVCPHRAVTDVSAVADPATGVAVYQRYGGRGWSVFGGTSTSAPIIAAVYALAGTPAATEIPAAVPYAHPTHLTDVSTGRTGLCAHSRLCASARGWDGPSGLGTPRGIAAFTPVANGPRTGTGAGTGSGGITVTSGPSTVSVTRPAAQFGTVGNATALQILATDSAAGQRITYAASGLPAGLTINPATALIAGTPTTAGVAVVTVAATDRDRATQSVQFTWSIAAAPTCAGQKLAAAGFEPGTAGWVASAGVLRTSGPARTGVGYAELNGPGTATLSQTVAVPAGCTASLSYYLWVDTHEQATTAVDTLTVSVGGAPVQTLSNLDASTGYQRQTVDLSGFAGRTVTLTFTGVENGPDATAFRIDDTALTLS